MLFRPLRWLVRNFRTLFLAFGLALVVWVSSVIAADPNETRTYSNVPLETVGKASDMLITSEIPDTVSVTLFAPRSYLNQYQVQPGLLRSVLDLSGLEQGEHIVPIQVYPGLDPTRVEQKVPDTLSVILDKLVNQPKPIRLEVTGEPARGYQVGEPSLEIGEATVTGAESRVARVETLVALVDITGADAPVETDLAPRPVDANGVLVSGVQVSPERVQVTIPVNLLAGFRNVVVRVVTIGQVANGYRLTNITVSPPNVVVSSSDPELVNNLPGFVDTEPLDLTGLRDDIEVRLPISLPDGISVVGEQNVLVLVSIAAIEGSLSINLPVEVVGLGTGLSALAAPDTVDVILSGPVLELDALNPADVRVVVDVTGLEPGVYSLDPQVSLRSELIQVEAILPESLEVTIVSGPLPTATVTPFGTPGATSTVDVLITPTGSFDLTPTPTP
jgi:YbbR domain-containing protein